MSPVAVNVRPTPIAVRAWVASLMTDVVNFAVPSLRAPLTQSPPDSISNP